MTAIAILSTGMVTSVGQSSAASCSAIRAGVTNPSEIAVLNSAGDFILGHRVVLENCWQGSAKLVRMASMAIRDCLQYSPRNKNSCISLILCLAEKGRPGADSMAPDRLIDEIETRSGFNFSPESRVLRDGRIGVVTALMHAKSLIVDDVRARVLIVAIDSLLTPETLNYYDAIGRLLSANNSNGFLPGEGAAAILVASAAHGRGLTCTGLGVAHEDAPIDSEKTFKAVGLTRAIQAALVDAACRIELMSFRIADVSGEHYYFKEASLAIARLLRARKDEFQLWHPSECIGEAGSVSGAAVICVAFEAYAKGYALGPDVLCHFAIDDGRRGAAVMQYREV